MKLSIIIVSYNVSRYLRQCINSIYQSDINSNFELIVVDNHSHDDTCDMLANEFPLVRLIKNSNNLGFSKAVNIGISYSLGDYICFMNPDTLISSNTFQVLINYLENNVDVGSVGPKILNADGSLQLASKRSFPTPISSFFKFIGLSYLFPKNKYFGQYNLTYLDEDKMHDIDSLSGSFMLMPKLVCDSIGEFDERFFMYGEDLDYCYRIKSKGYRIVYNPLTTIIHYKGESVKTAPFDMVNIFYSAIKKYFIKYSEIHPTWSAIKYFISFGIFIRKMVTYCFSYSAKMLAFVIDIIIIGLSFLMSLYLWYKYYYNDIIDASTFISHYPLFLDLIICWFISSYCLGLYKKYYLSYGRSFVAGLITLLLSATSTYFIGVFAYSRAVLIFTIALISMLTSVWRVLLHILYRYRKISFPLKSSLFSRNALILGTSEESMRIGRILSANPTAHFIVLGYIGDCNISNTNKFLGHFDDICLLVKKYHVNEIIIPENWGSIKQIINLLNKLKYLKINFKFVPEGKKMLIGKGLIENLSGVPLMDIEFPLFAKAQKLNKRIFDIILSAFLIALTLPFHLYYIAFRKIKVSMIWTTNSKHMRIVYYQSNFNIIQDMPLLFLVFKGSLSFVGTQLLDISHKNPDLIVKPGLTGLPHLTNVGNDSIREFEHYYAMNYTMMFDIEILLKSLLRI